jgi:hypothetical protein
MKLIYQAFENNGILRGWLYTGLAAAAVVGPALERWKDAPPENGYEIASVTLSALVAAATALRAYLDQHLSRNEQTPPNPSPAPDGLHQDPVR